LNLGQNANWLLVIFYNSSAAHLIIIFNSLLIQYLSVHNRKLCCSGLLLNSGLMGDCFIHMVFKVTLTLAEVWPLLQISQPTLLVL